MRRSSSCAVVPSARAVGLEFVDEVGDEVAHRAPIGSTGVGVLDDQVCIDAEASCQPAVLAYRPFAWSLGQGAVVGASVAPGHEGLGEPGERHGFADGRGRIAHAEFDGAEIGVRADVPPDLTDRLDALRVEQRRHEGLEVGPVGELWREPGGRQRLEHLAPGRRESRVLALEVRARRRQRQEQREVTSQLVDDRDRTTTVSHPDVHVHATDQQPTRRPLHRLDEFVIARIGADQLIASERERMGARTHQRESSPIGGEVELGERCTKVEAGIGRRLADAGDDLDRALEQFVLGLRVFAPGVGGPELAEQLGGRGDELARGAIDHVELHLDADRRPFVACELDRHVGRRSADLDQRWLSSVSATCSGVVCGENRATTAPSASTRNFSKFHVMSALSPIARLLGLEPRVERCGAVAVHLDLVEHREGHTVVRRGEFEDLLVGSGFLVGELVAWKAEDGHIVVVIVKCTQTCVLRCETSSAGDVDDQAHLAAELVEADLLSGDRGHLEIVEG